MIFQAQTSQVPLGGAAQVTVAVGSSSFWVTLTDPAFQLDVLAVCALMSVWGVLLVIFCLLQCLKKNKIEEIPVSFAQGVLVILLADTSLLTMAAFTKIYEVEPKWFLVCIFYFMTVGIVKPEVFGRWLKMGTSAVERRLHKFFKGLGDGS